MRTTKSQATALRILPKIAVLLALMTIGSAAWGQASTSVRGTVIDPSGKAVPGASVALSNSESKIERTTTTGEQGEYQFLFVPPGTYRLAVAAPGFRHYEQTDLQLLVNTPATANVQLKIGGTNETVTMSPTCSACRRGWPTPVIVSATRIRILATEQ
jgi:hypothetical protein